MFLLQVQTTTMCISVSLSGFVVLGCMFAPKVHIIMFQPQKNVTSHRLNLNRFSVSGAATSYASHGRLFGYMLNILYSTKSPICSCLLLFIIFPTSYLLNSWQPLACFHEIVLLFPPGEKSLVIVAKKASSLTYPDVALHTSDTDFSDEVTGNVLFLMTL